MSGWGCPNELNGQCQRVKGRACDPGMKGCILHGRFVFSNPAKNRPPAHPTAAVSLSSCQNPGMPAPADGTAVSSLAGDHEGPDQGGEDQLRSPCGEPGRQQGGFTQRQAHAIEGGVRKPDGEA